tara:strand:+ start:5503 stop:5898 length:396 start_codon:yes stop_codon:yes gene_type:complete
MGKPIKGDIVWGDSEKKENPKFVPNPNGNFSMYSDGDTTLVMSDWDILTPPPNELKLPKRKEGELRIEDRVHISEDAMMYVDDGCLWISNKGLPKPFRLTQGIVSIIQEDECIVHTTSFKLRIDRKYLTRY